MEEVRVLIVVNDAEAGKEYARVLSETGAACDLAHSFTRMAEMATEQSYNGLVIDLLTMVRCSKEEKAIAYECINLFPVLRVKWDKKQKRINLSPLEQTFSPNPESVVKFFLEQRCRSFKARPLRKYKRKQLILNALISTDPSFNEKSTSKGFTTNVSASGVFLHSMKDFPEDRTLWLRFLEFADQTPIAVTVRWSLEWGVSRSIPGIGGRFESLTEAQQRELQALLST